MQVNHYTQLVSPEIAAEWLKLNTTNRKLDRHVVDRYANDMSNGYWKYAGDPIRFDRSGKLIDGQQRLSAIIKSNTTQLFSIVAGLSEEAFAVIDRGKQRNFNDFIKITYPEYPYYQEMSAIARVCHAYENGIFHSYGVNVKNTSHQILFNWIKNAKDFEAIVSEARRLVKKNRGVLKVPYAGFALYEFSKIDPEAAKYFVSKLILGDNLDSNDPIKVLRDKLALFQFQKKRLSRRELVILLFKCWNYYRSNQKIESIKMPNKETAIPNLI